MSTKKQNDVIEDITEQTLLTLDGVAEEISEQAAQEEVDNFIAERALKEDSKEVIAIANKVKEYKKGDKTNFGVVVDVSPSSITFKGKDTPKTKIVFNQRKMGSKDYVLSALSKMNESVYEDDQEMEAEEETIETLASKLELTDEQVETLAVKSNEKYGEEGDAVLLDMLKMVAIPTDEEHKSAMMELIVNGDFDALEAHIAEMKEKQDSEEESEEEESDEEESEMKEMEKEESDEEDELDEDINWDFIQSMYVKDLIDYVVVPFASAVGAFGAVGVFKAKQKIKDWLRDKKDAADANQLAKLIKDAIEKIKKDSKAQDMIAQINANPYDRNSNNTERNKLIKPYKAHLKSILSDEQYEVLDDIYFASLKEEMKSDMENEKEEMNENMEDWKSEYKDVAEIIFTNLNRARDARLFFGMFGKPGYLTRSLDEIRKAAKKENVNLQNDPFFGAIESLMIAINDRNDDSLVNEFFEKYKPQIQNLDVFLGKLNRHIDGLGKKRIGEEDEDEMEEMKVDKTDIEELVKDEEGLTEEFKEKASIIFEAAVASKVKETKALLKEQYATRLNEEVETLKEDLVEKIDSYLTYAVETWVADNKVAVESTLRTEITESFIGSLKNLFTEHYIEVPESKVDLFSDMETQVSALKEQVKTKGRIANALADRVEKLTRQKVIAEASAGLADTQIAKLSEMVEDVEFINEETFAKKVSTIREFYVNRRSDNAVNTLNENVDDNTSFISKETIVENQTEGDLSPSMQNYLSAMSRMNKATTANLVM